MNGAQNGQNISSSFPLKKRIRKILKSIRSFSLRRYIYTKLLEKAQATDNTKKIERYNNKLKALDEVKKSVLIKYIIKELFLYFLVSFLFFFVVFFVNNILLLAQTILEQRVPVPTVAKLIVYCLPAIIAQSAPFATLVGFLMCLGRMVSDNEILILRASGQRYSIILIPVLILGLLISIFSFVMNDYFLPLGTINYNKLKKDIVQSNPMVEIEPNSIKQLNDFSLVIGDQNENGVEDIIFFDDSSDSEKKIIIAKDTVAEKTDIDGLLLELKMQNPYVLIMNKKNQKSYDVIHSDDLTLNVFDSVIDQSGAGLSPREMTSYDLYKKIKVLEEEQKLTKIQLNTYYLEYHKKFSIPFGSIFFAILAFPLALLFSKKDGQTIGLILGIVISVLYWASSMLGQLFGIRSGYDGFWMMWGPDFFIGIVGLLLYLRLKRK
ncbi:MAG: LptF/LptG family permease [Treponema sp.]|nr:LptF/LptG family permease [Treponema sp.]